MCISGHLTWNSIIISFIEFQFFSLVFLASQHQFYAHLYRYLLNINDFIFNFFTVFFQYSTTTVQYKNHLKYFSSSSPHRMQQVYIRTTQCIEIKKINLIRMYTSKFTVVLLYLFASKYICINLVFQMVKLADFFSLFHTRIYFLMVS